MQSPSNRFQFQLESVISKLIDEGTTVQNNDKSRLLNIRFSQLPFCPIRWFLSIPGGSARKSRKPFGFAYFTSVGTTVHTVFQDVIQSIDLPHGFEIIADWKCKSCSTVHSFSVKPEACVSCKSTAFSFEEHEIDIKWPKRRVRALGHVDCILRYPISKTAFSYFVIDFKTTSLKASSAKEMKISEAYRFQLLSYVSAIQHQQKVKVSAAALVFIPRDSPFKSRVVMVDFDSQELRSMGNHMSKSTKTLETLQSISTIEDLEPFILSRPCAETVPKEYEGCQYAKQCAGNDKGCTKALQSVFLKSTLPIHHDPP